MAEEIEVALGANEALIEAPEVVPDALEANVEQAPEAAAAEEPAQVEPEAEAAPEPAEFIAEPAPEEPKKKFKGKKGFIHLQHGVFEADATLYFYDGEAAVTGGVAAIPVTRPEWFTLVWRRGYQIDPLTGEQADPNEVLSRFSA